jgi:TonB family protein
MIPLVIEAAVRSCALSLIVWLALAITRQRNPHLGKTVWTTVLLASLAMPLLMGVHVVPPSILAPQYVLTLQPGAVLVIHAGSRWSTGISALYGLGVIALLGRYAARLLQMRCVRRDARVLREPWTDGSDVRLSVRVPSPATFGSTILLPEDCVRWSAQKLAAVMAHERSHVLYKDCYVLWLARLYTCVFWFNPLAWWLRRRLAALAETTSDEAATEALGDCPRYAEILLEFAKQRRASSVATAMARPNISIRIERILSGINPSAVPKRSKRLLAMAALLPAVPAVAAMAAPLQSSPVRLAQAAAPALDDRASDPGARSASFEPHITHFGGLGQLAKYYPPEAKRQGIEGEVDLAVTLDAQGRATDTLILSESPPDMGFGAAASAAAHTMEYSNPTGRSVQFTFRVNFALNHDDNSTDAPTPTN